MLNVGVVSPGVANAASWQRFQKGPVLANLAVVPANCFTTRRVVKRRAKFFEFVAFQATVGIGTLCVPQSKAESVASHAVVLASSVAALVPWREFLTAAVAAHFESGSEPKLSERFSYQGVRLAVVSALGYCACLRSLRFCVRTSVFFRKFNSE